MRGLCDRVTTPLPSWFVIKRAATLKLHEILAHSSNCSLTMSADLDWWWVHGTSRRAAAEAVGRYCRVCKRCFWALGVASASLVERGHAANRQGLALSDRKSV